ncbi:LPS assembly lipoprotein LptE [Ciceribacter selenitireducens]
MSSDPVRVPVRRTSLLLCLGLSALLASCQVRPLYDDTAATRQNLGAIAYSDADDRVELEVRNQLVFMTEGGAGEPATPQYRVDLKVESDVRGVLLEQSSDTAAAGRVTVSADYTLERVADATVLKVGHRQAVSLVDFPTQQFAKLRAARDAENRAARELAELIRADLAMVLGR